WCHVLSSGPASAGRESGRTSAISGDWDVRTRGTQPATERIESREHQNRGLSRLDRGQRGCTMSGSVLLGAASSATLGGPTRPSLGGPRGGVGTPPTGLPPAGSRPVKFDYLVAQRFVTREQLTAALADAREQQVSVESLLMARHGVRKADIGVSLSLFYRCPFLACDTRITVPAELLQNLSVHPP